MHALGKCQFINDGTYDSAETANRFCPQENLVAVKTFGSFDRRRHHRMEGYARIRFFTDPAVDSLGSELCMPLMFGANVNHQQMQKRGILASLPKFNFLFPESFEIVVAGGIGRRKKKRRTPEKNF